MAKQNYMKASVKTPVADRNFLHGMREIGEYMGLSVDTVRRYILRYRLPLTKRGDGGWMTSKTLIDQWLLSMAEQTYEAQQENKARRLKKSSST